MGMIGCYDTNRTKEADYNGFVITQTVMNSSFYWILVIKCNEYAFM